MPNLYSMTMRNQQTNNLQAEIAPKLTPAPYYPRYDVLSPEIMAKQATINIAIIGHDRSQLLEAIFGDNTESHSSFLGYSFAKIFRCSKCLLPDCYKLYPSTQKDDPPCSNPDCDGTLRLFRHVSFVDYPNQETLMARMMAGDAIIDACLLLVASNTVHPQLQISRHLAAIEMMNLGDRTLILQNKIDLLESDEKFAMKNFEEIKTSLKGTRAENAPIIPISSELKYNIDAVWQHICEKIPVPARDFISAPEMQILRSFDVNKPEMSFDEMKGGVVAGRILKGVLKIGDKVEIRPGYIVKDDNNRISHYIPIMSKVVSLTAGNNSLEYAVPGGLVSVELAIDPSLAESSKLAGNTLGLVDQTPEVYQEVELSYYLLKKLLGSKTGARVDKITQGELLKINIGSSSIVGSVKSVEDQRIKISLISKPVCAKIGDKITISRRIEQTWRLIGWGMLEDGEALTIMKP